MYPERIYTVFYLKIVERERIYDLREVDTPTFRKNVETHAVILQAIRKNSRSPFSAFASPYLSHENKITNVDKLRVAHQHCTMKSKSVAEKIRVYYCISTRFFYFLFNYYYLQFLSPKKKKTRMAYSFLFINKLLW